MYIDKRALVEKRLHPGIERRIFHILTGEDIGDVIFCFYTVVCVKTLVHITKRKLRSGLEIWTLSVSRLKRHYFTN